MVGRVGGTERSSLLAETDMEAILRDGLGPREMDASLAEGALSRIETTVVAIIGGASGAEPAAPDLESPLSARELEVATLVAGLTDRAIAAELVLSTRTIDSHVQHILDELQFASRAQIAGWIAGRRQRMPPGSSR